MSNHINQADTPGALLDGFSVVLSGAVPERENWTEPGEDLAIKEFLAHFSALVFNYEGRIIHGSHPSFTPILVHQAERFRNSSDDKPLTLLISELWAKDLEEDTKKRYRRIARLVVTPQVGSEAEAPDDAKTRNPSLTLLRERLIEQADAVVAVGGKLHTDESFTPGVEEELNLARARRVPCFLIGGLGGTTGRMARSSLENFSAGNGLTEDQREQLASSTDIASMAGILVNHLIVHKQELLLKEMP